MEKRMSQGMSIQDIAEKHKTSIKAIEIQIEKGIQVEKEHTSSEAEAKRIAMDHLVEIPDYYDRLLAMEKGAKKDLGEEKKFSPVPKDKESGLPKKYVAGLSKSTAKKRAAHWNKMAKKSDKDPAAYEPAPGDANAKTKESKYTKKYRQMYGEEIELDEAANAGLSKKAKESGVPLSILKKVYSRGMAAWNSGHRPGTTPQQWGMARVNSYITKGKTYYTADKDLREAKARDYNAKAMWGKVKAQTFKTKKGKGSYSRKDKHGSMYESKVLTEGASNFSTMEHFPLLVWFDWEQKVDEWMNEAREFVEEEYADVFNDMMEDEIEQLVQEKFEEISDENSKDIAILSEDEFYNLEFDKDEFNIQFRHTFDYDGDAVTIEAGYYEGMQLLVPDEQYFKDEEKSMIEEFLYTIKEKYYLTELGGSGAYGMGYSNLGSGKGLYTVKLTPEEEDVKSEEKEDDLEEEFLPPSPEKVESFLKVLRDIGFNIDSTKRWDGYGEDEIDANVHIQITSIEKDFTVETFETKMDEIAKAIKEFDPERKNSITYSFDLMPNGSITAGLDMRPEWLDPKDMVKLEVDSLEEESKKNWGKPGKDYLKKLAKKHKKTDKKGARGWFVALGSGDVQRNINRFNSRMPGDSAPSATSSTITSAAGYTAPSSSGSSMAVSATAAGGLGEAMETGYSLTEKIEKHDVLNPNLWEGNKLRPQVREKILEIVDLFIEGLRENNIRIMVKDIVIIGSNASYNYSDTSDVDVHLIVDTSEFDCPDNLYPFLYSSYRSIFNKKYDIEFYGTGVELFVDMEDTPTVSNGIYSLNTGWVKEPVKEEIPEIDMEKFNAEFSKWEDKYFELIKGEEEVETAEKPIEDVLKESLESAKIDAIDDYMEDVYDLRKVSLQKDGEYSIGNLIFKELRSLGYLDNLKVLKNKLKSQELSLKENLIVESFDTKPMKTLEEVDMYASLAKGGDATYDLNEEGKPVVVNLVSGFQVSFFRPELREQGNEALKLVLDTIGSSFGQQFLGFYGGVPEISYTLESSMAKEVARIFNQESIWDNEKGELGYTPNEFFDKAKNIDYKTAVEELKELLGKKEGEVK